MQNNTCRKCLQWNLHKTDTIGDQPFGRYLFPWQSVVEITTTVTNRYDELDEVVCELLPDKQTVV